MRTALLATTIALFLVLAGFFAVYADHGPGSVYADRDPERIGVVLHFLDSREDPEIMAFLDPAERSHMADVRKVVGGFKIAFVILVALLVAQLVALKNQKTITQKTKNPNLNSHGGNGNFKIFRRALLRGGLGAIVIAALLAAASLLDFSSFWNGPFHAMLFPQGNWQFAQGSALIALFPEEFFYRYATHVLLAIASFGAVAVLASLVRKQA